MEKYQSLIVLCAEMRGVEAALVEALLHTGRTHQIRVHLASEGHPIAGDDKYGDFELNKALQKPSKSQNLSQTTTLKRMFLHAWRLQLTHPSTAERVELQNELPAELQSFVDSLNTEISHDN